MRVIIKDQNDFLTYNSKKVLNNIDNIIIIDSHIYLNYKHMVFRGHLCAVLLSFGLIITSLIF